MSPIIAHFDMDAFFAAIEERDNPQWRGLPIVVGADPQSGHGRGVVSTANYAARKYGIRSALPITRAWQAAQAAETRGEPKIIFVSGSWQHYHDVSEHIMKILHQYIPTLQQRSVDEAYGDLTFTGSFTAAEQLCRKIKQAIQREVKLTVSVGIGPNKLIAKIASDYHKPDGLTVVVPEQVLSFLAPLSIQSIPGVGPKTAEELARHQIRTIADARLFSRQQLSHFLGKWGEDLYDKVRGIGSTSFKDSGPAKSISEQVTLREDTDDPKILIPRLLKTSAYVYERLTSEGFTSCRTVTVTIRFADFFTVSRAHTAKTPYTKLAPLQHQVLYSFLPFLDHRKNPQHKLIRLIGVRLEKLQ